MKKSNIVIVAIVVLIIAGIAALSMSGGTTQKGVPAQTANLLKTHSAKLSLGKESAPVRIVEYSDILCPYCAKINEKVVPQIKSDYIDTGKVHYEVRPVAVIAPDSQRAAEGAYCAADQSKFWDYYNTAYKVTWDNYYSKGKLPSDISIFSASSIASFGNSVGLDMGTWSTCLSQHNDAAEITNNQQELQAEGASGTPFFVINSQVYSGAAPYSVFQTIIDAELRKASGS